MFDDKNGDLAELLREQIRATNRVNHAVRAIVIPSTIVLIAFLIAVPFLVIGLIASTPAVLFLAGAILLIGGIMAIFSQINESKLSDMPYSYSVAESDSLTDETSEAAIAGSSAAAPDQKVCGFCGAKYPKARMACPDCGMN